VNHSPLKDMDFVEEYEKLVQQSLCVHEYLYEQDLQLRKGLGFLRDGSWPISSHRYPVSTS